MVSVMKIRTANPHDAGEISALIYSLVEDYLAIDLTPEGKDTLNESISEESLVRCLNDNRFRFHVVADGDRIAGVVGIRDNAHVYHLFVSKAYQGLGLARSLWNTARAVCEQNGNSGRYTVNSSTFAREFYEKLGFTRTGPPEVIKGVSSIPMELVVVQESERK